jgi:hypothetical protein
MCNVSKTLKYFVERSLTGDHWETNLVRLYDFSGNPLAVSFCVEGFEENGNRGHRQ